MEVQAQRFVEALFDYTYTDDSGYKVSIVRGQEYILLEKSNADWWHVENPRNQERIYIPASYVQVISKNVISIDTDRVTHISIGPASPRNPEDIKAKKYTAPLPPDKFFGVENTMNNKLPAPDYEKPDAHSPVTFHIHPEPDFNASDSKNIPKQDYENGISGVSQEVSEYANMKSLNLEATETATVNTSNNKQNVEYANLRDIRDFMGIHPPENIQKVHIETTEGHWEKHTDKNTGQVYYYNPVTRQTSWTLPENGSLENSPQDEQQSPLESPPILDEWPKLTRGYSQETDETGELIYVNNSNNEKWYCSTDKEGQMYYYKNSGETVWDLPEIELQAASKKPNSRRAGSPPSQFHELRDMLNKTKTLENGKKCKKNWSESYCVLTGHYLSMYKDKKSYSKQTSPHGKPEATIDLHMAKVEWGGKEKSSKKNVIQIWSMGSEYLLQCDDPIKIHEWYINITAAVAHFHPQLPPEDSTDHSPTAALGENFDDTSVAHRPSRGRHSKSKKQEIYTLYEDTSLDTLEKRSRIRDRLRELMRMRPSKESLERQGILKEERIFGSHLLHLCEQEKSAVPRFVLNCITAIEHRGLDIDGIYRVSGNLAQVQKLRFLVDATDQYDLRHIDFDIHVLTGSLKLFFRELKEPLIPFDYFERFLATIKLPARAGKLQAFQGLISVLPKPNHDTLKVLCQHLIRVCENKQKNRMQLQNLAIIFGPTLMWPEKESSNIAVSMMYQTSIVEFILLEFDNLF